MYAVFREFINTFISKKIFEKNISKFDKMKTKAFKIIVLAVAGLVINLTVLPAQPERHRQGPPPVPDSTQVSKMISDLTTDLSLSAEQASQIKTLLGAHFKEVKTKLDAEKVRRDKNREEMEALQAKFEGQLKTILSPEQQQKFVEFQKKNDPRKDFNGGPK